MGSGTSGSNLPLQEDQRQTKSLEGEPARSSDQSQQAQLTHRRSTWKYTKISIYRVVTLEYSVILLESRWLYVYHNKLDADQLQGLPWLRIYCSQHFSQMVKSWSQMK